MCTHWCPVCVLPIWSLCLPVDIRRTQLLCRNSPSWRGASSDVTKPRHREILHCEAAKSSRQPKMSCHRTGYERHNIHTPSIQIRWERETPSQKDYHYSCLCVYRVIALRAFVLLYMLCSSSIPACRKGRNVTNGIMQLRDFMMLCT